MRFFAVALIFFGVTASFAQTPEVPHKMQFAGITLTIRDDARREIQVDVDALTQHARYFTMKVERARTYFPLIEKIFAEEGVPDDFKFLVLQESALVSDAVSVSNAVGFWQFKDFTALEMGMRVDKAVDERMNLVSATHGAARYIKQNNNRFNNWLLALQSYQMGAGGVMRSVGTQYNGAQHMEITPETYWYVKKYLAHKVAFQEAVSGEPQLKVIALTNSKKSLKEIATDLSAGEEELREYNKWLKGDVIPDDKSYTVFVPVGKRDLEFNKLVLTSDKASRAKADKPAEIVSVEPAAVNALPVIVAHAGENVSQLAARAKVDISTFLKYNEISIDHPVEPGTVYYLEKKKTRGEAETYKSKIGDDLWTISQVCGIRIRNLKKYNNLDADTPLAPGTVLWLRGPKPEENVLLPETEVAVLEDEAFDWYTKSPKEPEQQKSPVLVGKESKSTPDALTRVIAGPTNLTIETTTTIRPDVHQVKPGDTYYAIAKQYNLEITDLLNWNGLNIQSGLKPGQIIKLTDNEPIKADEKIVLQAGPIRHEVQPTDTLYSIARQYGVTIKDIMEWNHKSDFSLTRGEKLEIRRK